MSKQLLGICTAVTENTLWPTVPQYEGSTCFPNTWIFYYPMRRPPLSSPWSRGGCCQLRSQSWLSVSQHMPALSIITPLLQTSGMETEKLSEMGEHKAGPPQRIFDGASQLGFPNSLSLLSEGYPGKQAPPCLNHHLFPPVYQKSNFKPKRSHVLSYFVKVIQAFRLSVFFKKEIKRRN